MFWRFVAAWIAHLPLDSLFGYAEEIRELFFFCLDDWSTPIVPPINHLWMAQDKNQWDSVNRLLAGNSKAEAVQKPP